MKDFRKLVMTLAFGVAYGSLVTTSALAADVQTDLSAPLRAQPKIGGHFGLGLTLVTVGTPPTTLISRDTLQLGPVVGVNFGIDEHWSIDLESALLSQWRQQGTAAPGTTFLFDPGVVYNWGAVATGLRLAARTPSEQAEIGLIPIVVKAFGSGPLKYYAELDLPMFVGGSTTGHPGGTFTFTTFVQTGIAF